MGSSSRRKRKRGFEWNAISSVPEDSDTLEEEECVNSLNIHGASYRKLRRLSTLKKYNFIDPGFMSSRYNVTTFPGKSCPYHRLLPKTALVLVVFFGIKVGFLWLFLHTCISFFAIIIIVFTITGFWQSPKIIAFLPMEKLSSIKKFLPISKF